MSAMLADPELFDPEHFDLGRYLAALPEQMLTSSDGRRELTRLDPLAFALLYLPHHLRSESTGGRITLSEFHVDLLRQARSWVKPLSVMKAHRDVYVAPREIGKSTWLFLILPLWAAAHEHVKFIAAFAASADQVALHLMTFRHELETNALLNTDFAELCEPARHTRRQQAVASSRGQIQQRNGFVFMAKGVDAAVAGLKVGAMRPQLIILDDVEPDESNYSGYQKERRQVGVMENILPLNVFARVLLVGTVVMSGSIVHEAVKSAISEEKIDWVDQEQFKVHYYPAILDNDDGTERSIWPEKWPLADLQAMRHTRSFLKNFMNRPLSGSEAYWNPADYRYETAPAYTHTVLSIDPAVTTHQRSDWTGVAVVSRNPALPSGRLGACCYVRHASHVRKSGQDLRTYVLGLIEQFPEVELVLIESNQGGDLWKQVLHGLPVKVKTVHQTESKSYRATLVLNHYQRGRVFHTDRHAVLEEEQTGYPRALHDDVLDAAGTAIRYFLASDTRRKSGPQVSTASYL